VIIEVLPSITEACDWGKKFKCYHKEAPNHWTLVFAGDKDEAIQIGTCQVSLPDVYENVDFTLA
jgi:hypothetical protein